MTKAEQLARDIHAGSVAYWRSRGELHELQWGDLSPGSRRRLRFVASELLKSYQRKPQTVTNRNAKPAARGR